MFSTAASGCSAKHVVVPFHHHAHVDPGGGVPLGVAFPVVHDTGGGGDGGTTTWWEAERAPAPTVPAAAAVLSRPSIASHYVIQR